MKSAKARNSPQLRENLTQTRPLLLMQLPGLALRGHNRRCGEQSRAHCEVQTKQCGLALRRLFASLLASSARS
jgi:hypothetical protein